MRTPWLVVGLLLLGCGRTEGPGTGNSKLSGAPAPDASFVPVPEIPAETPDSAPAPAPDTAVATDAERWPLAGLMVKDERTPGTGPCLGRTFRAVLEMIWAARPDLRNAPPISTPQHEGFVAVTGFLDRDGFNIIFDRGSGDCPSGCIEHELWYFSTDPTCNPLEVGHGRSGRCFDARRVPAWGIPPDLDPSRICGS